MLRILRHGVVVLLLTLLTQIGGLAWLLALTLRRFLPSSRRSVFLILFAGVYAGATLVTHQVAPIFGRVPLPCFTSASLVVRTPLYCALNRNYVTPELKAAAEAYADHMASSFPGTKTLALDANFPFVTGFPLMPHLSHDDGRKLDLALYYRDDAGNFRNGETQSPLGYFAFQQPLANSLQPCANRKRFLSLRWDMNWLRPLFPDWDIEPARMKEACNGCPPRVVATVSRRSSSNRTSRRASACRATSSVSRAATPPATTITSIFRSADC